MRAFSCTSGLALRGLAFPALLALVTATAPGCNKGHPLTMPGDADPGAATEPGQDTNVAAAELAPVEHPRDLLPLDSLVVFEGKSFARGIEIIERDRLAKEIPEAYQQIKQELEREFGYDLFVADNLRAIGIDPDGEAGAVFLNVEQEAFAFYAKLADPGRFRETVLGAAARHDIQLHPLSMGGVEILRNQSGRVSVVLRGNVAYLVRSDEPKEGQVDYARMIATMNPSQSLTQSANFKKASMGYIEPDALLYINPAALAEQSIRKSHGYYDHNWASEELESARQRGAEPEEIARLEESVKDVDAQNKRYKKERENEDEIVRMIFGDLGTMVFRADVRKSGVMVEGRALMGADAFVRTLFRNSGGKAPILQALNGTPLFVNAATVEVEPAVDLIDRLARADGMSWKLIVEEVREKIGIDLNEDIRPNLTGSVGFGITLDPIPAKLGPRGATSLLGFTGHAQFKDAAKLDAALEKLGPNFKLDKIAFRKDKVGWVADVPDWRNLYLGRAGDQLVVTTDPTVMARLQTGAAGTIVQTKPAGAITALSLENRAYSMGMGLSQLAGWFLFGSTSHSMSGVDMRATSAKAKATKRKLAKVEKKMHALEAAHSYEQLKAVTKMMEPFGISVAAVAEDDLGFSMQGGQFLPGGSIADLIVHTVQLSGQSDFGVASPELDATRTEFFDLMRQLEEQDESRQMEVAQPLD